MSSKAKQLTSQGQAAKNAKLMELNREAVQLGERMKELVASYKIADARLEQISKEVKELVK